MEKGEPFALLVGMQMGAATVESSMELPQKLKMDLPFDGNISKGTPNTNLLECKHP